MHRMVLRSFRTLLHEFRYNCIMDYRYTVYSVVLLGTVITCMVQWLTARYCFRHRRDKVQVGPGRYVCPDCHEPNLSH